MIITLKLFIFSTMIIVISIVIGYVIYLVVVNFQQILELWRINRKCAQNLSVSFSCFSFSSLYDVIKTIIAFKTNFQKTCNRLKNFLDGKWTTSSTTSRVSSSL